ILGLVGRTQRQTKNGSLELLRAPRQPGVLISAHEGRETLPHAMLDQVPLPAWLAFRALRHDRVVRIEAEKRVTRHQAGPIRHVVNSVKPDPTATGLPEILPLAPIAYLQDVLKVLVREDPVVVDQQSRSH